MIAEEYLTYLETQGGIEIDERGQKVLAGLTFEETIDYLSYAAREMAGRCDDLSGIRYLSLARKHCAAHQRMVPLLVNRGDLTLH